MKNNAWTTDVWVPCKLTQDDTPLTVLQVAFPTKDKCGEWIGQTPPYNNGKWRPMEMDQLPPYVRSQKQRVLTDEKLKDAMKLVSVEKKNEIRKTMEL